MAGVEARDFDSPDETRAPDKTLVHIVRVGGTTVGRIRLEPGWRWSECIKPVVGTESCRVRHVGLAQSGRLHVEHEDGSDQEIRPGHVYVIEPMATIRSWATVKPTTEIGLPPETTTTPAAPFTIAVRASPASGRPRASTRRATFSAPRASRPPGIRALPASIRKTTSGSRTWSNASKSPSREAERNASTILRCVARSGSVLGVRP